ncbi:hypothetical protein FQN54_004418 [Arachnomyces sp. PD_36]|nr:hypothetical protein FQN54_004418 [Arachnomyces sp. PD_36]
MIPVFKGVAYSTKFMKNPRHIQGWPGMRRGALENKVPTAVKYRAGQKRILSWGFECSPLDVQPECRVVERFKLFLDDDFLQHSPKNVGTHEDVQMWFEDFLTVIRQHAVDDICSFLQLGKDRWESQTVHYVFSVPTTWSTEVIGTFEKVVRRAGFTTGKLHSVEIRLSEAEAAAVYTAWSLRHQPPATDSGSDTDSIEGNTCSAEMQLSKDEILLVCDAGGGTTDISVLQVEAMKSIPEGNGTASVAQLTRLDHVDASANSPPRRMRSPIARGGMGASVSATNLSRLPTNPIPHAIGSDQIDAAFREEVVKRLKNIPTDDIIPSINPTDAAQKMLKERFIPTKREFGTARTRGMGIFPFAVPGIRKDYSNAAAHIENGKMIFTWGEIQDWFETQIVKIFRAMDDKLGPLRPNKIGSIQSYIVLSGGLGSSEYVQKRIRENYGSEEITIAVSSQPQLAVCKGLVIDQVHQLKYKQSILSKRSCSSSYGVLFNEIYDKKIHSSQQTKEWKNPIDKRSYAVDRVHWLVREGEEISCNKPICHRFYRTVSVKNPEVKFEDIIATSRTKSGRLPTSIREGDAGKAGKVITTLNPRWFREGREDIERKDKKRFGVKIGKYWRITLEVRVYIGFADLRFEIWLADQLIGEQDDDIEVTWAFSGGDWLGREGMRTGGDSVDEERDGTAWQRNLLGIPVKEAGRL